MSLLDILPIFFKVGLFTIGGGLAAVPVRKRETTPSHGRQRMVGLNATIRTAQLKVGRATHL